jgi:hypothetical protein
MRRTTSCSSILAIAAGPRLRCFLGVAVWVLLCTAGSGSLTAQVDIPGPERLSHVEGYVVNPVGRPVADLEVALLQDDKVAYQTRTDKSGEFRFEHVSGHFTLRVARSEYSPATQEIVVANEIVTTLERKKLYVILGPGACQDACSSVFTNKKDFDRAIREKNRR